MTINKNEALKIINFILTNKRIIIQDYGLFSRDTLILLMDVVKGKKEEFELSKEEENELINVFLNGDCIFNRDTPLLFLDNIDCINKALEQNIDNVNYIENVTPEIQKRVVKQAIRKNYILKVNSPSFLKNNYIIAKNSIRLDVDSANFIDWEAMNKEEFDSLINEAINRGYMLKKNSNIILCDNNDIVLNSIMKDIKTLRYSTPFGRSHPDIFKFLIKEGYEFTKDELEKQKLYTLGDRDVMKYILEKMDILSKDNLDFLYLFNRNPNDMDKYIERYANLYAKAINTTPTIKNLKSILDICAELEWEDYRNDNLDMYANIFGKICIELKDNKDYYDAIDELEFLDNMKNKLGDKYILLQDAMIRYHTLMHSNETLENIESVRDVISKLSALYISISKEEYKKEVKEIYLEDVKEFFTPRKDNQVIHKKIMDYKHKNKFRKLYKGKDKDICNFLFNVLKQYSHDIKFDTLWTMVDNFLNNNYSKMDSFIKAPKGWNDYKRYEEANKLVNRLNKHYIKYTDKEVARYLDIIRYDSESDGYYYEGPSFDIYQIDEYNDYKNKLDIFEKIKKEIIIRAKELDVDSNISDDEIRDISNFLPFTDDYFEFNGKSWFEVKDFIDSCTSSDIFIEPENLIDDYTYTCLTNYVLENDLFWMLLLLNSCDSLYDIGLDKEDILSTFNQLKKAYKLAKVLNYDINKYEDIITLCELSECADDKTIAILGKDIIFKLYKHQDYTEGDIKETIKTAKELICKMTQRDKSTVPYVKGRTNNYKYSMYTPQDGDILLSGIDTHACFKVGGNDNDFLHYCALDKNGFVIKITDIFGNFIGRASGFRNGNCVFINQLRTIYDEKQNHSSGICESEKHEIVETFYKACDDIIETSQKNANERNKIDHIFATKSYLLSGSPLNIDGEVSGKIGSKPMDHYSKDWKEFITNTDNLLEIRNNNDTFSTDYGNYGIICISSRKKSKKDDEIKINPSNIKPKNVDAVYKSPRSKIMAFDKQDINIINKINKINGIYSYLNNTPFENIKIPEKTTIFIGDNWYIIHDRGAIIKSCVLDFDKKAVLEYEIVKKAIQEYNIENTKDDKCLTLKK